MAAKTIQECIDMALCTGDLSDLKPRIINQLRDFFAHEVMRYEGDCLQMPGSIGFTRLSGAHDLFNRVFKDVPAFRKGEVK